MTKLSIATVFAAFLILAVNLPAFAQRSAQKTRGARAAYGQSDDVFGYKKKSKRKKNKTKKQKQPKRKAASPLNQDRTKSPWVN